MGGRLRASARSGVSATQISPRPYLVMVLTISGVAAPAAPPRSPSFSRSSSSATITSLPSRMSRIASSTRSNAITPPSCAVPVFGPSYPAASPPLPELHHEAAEHVTLQIDPGPTLETREIRVFPGVRDERDLGHIRRRQRVDRQAHPIDG